MGALMELADDYKATAFAEQAVLEIKKTISERGRPLSQSDSELLKAAFLENMGKFRKVSTGVYFFETRVGDSRINISASDLVFLKDYNFLSFKYATISKDGYNSVYKNICFFEGKFYSIATK